jgi:hypothetical protein
MVIKKIDKKRGRILQQIWKICKESSMIWIAAKM